MPLSVELTDIAQDYAEAMASGDVPYGHNPLLEEQVPEGWAAFAENVAWRSNDDSAAMVLQWVGSPAHFENMLRPWTHMGVGYAVAENGYSYGVLVFGYYPYGLEELPIPTVSPTPTSTPTVSPTPSATPTTAPTASPTPSATPTAPPSPGPTQTAAPTASPSPTAPPSVSPTPAPTPSAPATGATDQAAPPAATSETTWIPAITSPGSGGQNFPPTSVSPTPVPSASPAASAPKVTGDPAPLDETGEEAEVTWIDSGLLILGTGAAIAVAVLVTTGILVARSKR